MDDAPVMLVAAHKRADMPSDPLYLPVHVGHALARAELGYQPDDAGENISELNASYCELTGLYWAWKNLDADAVGLSHYRRYFAGSARGPRGRGILSRDEARDLLAHADVVVGKPRNYYVETIDSHYRNAHHGSDLDALRAVIAEDSPAYLDAFDQVMNGRKLSLYNMFLMRREHLDEYCDWLFRTLSAVEGRIDDHADRSSYQQRTYGYLGERLLNVWVHAHRDSLRIRTRRIVNTDGEPKIRKGVDLIKRKLTSTPKS